MVRVLVVEDEANIRDMIALNLRHAGMEVVEAESAEAALPLLAQKPGCDAAILDVMLPSLISVQVSAKLRKCILSTFLLQPISQHMRTEAILLRKQSIKRTQQ